MRGSGVRLSPPAPNKLNELQIRNSPMQEIHGVGNSNPLDLKMYLAEIVQFRAQPEMRKVIPNTSFPN